MAPCLSRPSVNSAPTRHHTKSMELVCLAEFVIPPSTPVPSLAKLRNRSRSLAHMARTSFMREKLEPSRLTVTNGQAFELKRWQVLLAGLLAVAAGIVLPRMAGLSGLPTTDEGYYAYYSMRMAHSLGQGLGLPSDGYIMLYPMLTAWVFEVTANPFVLLRLVDLAAATAAGMLFTIMLTRESRSVWFAAVLAMIFLYTMNWAGFVQNGYRNSIFLAYVPLLLAVILTQLDRCMSTRRLFAIGGLVSMGVLIREPFAGFAFLAVGAAWYRLGWRAAASIAAGGLIVALLVVTPVVALRGDLQGLLSSYLDAGDMFASVQDQRGTLFSNAVIAWSKVAWHALILSVLALIVLITGRLRGSRSVPARTFLWLGIAAVPLIEPVMKIGFPYHFASTLPGLAGLCALAWRTLPRHRLCALIPALMLGAAMWSCHAQASWQLKILPSAVSNAKLVAREGWPAEAHQSSNYLIAADLIQAHSQPGQTLSVSGFMLTLHPLTGRQPPSAQLSDLTLALIGMDMDGDRLLRAIRACPPDVIMTTTRTEWPGAALIEQTVARTGMYRHVGTVAVNEAISYGTFGGNVYARHGATSPSCGP